MRTTLVLGLSLLGLCVTFTAGGSPQTYSCSLKGSAVHKTPESYFTEYVQKPEYDAVYNMSTAFASEIADDIPGSLSGRKILEVTLWMGEWYGWIDPDAVTVNFYQGACPPLLYPSQTFTIPWRDWDKELVHVGLAQVYRITAALPQPVEVLPPMSIGAYVNISWGPTVPFAGICATPEWSGHGAGEAFLDGMNWGYTRWTSIAFYTGVPRDMAFGLLCIP
jgi:hypothetical protein